VEKHKVRGAKRRSDLIGYELLMRLPRSARNDETPCPAGSQWHYAALRCNDLSPDTYHLLPFTGSPLTTGYNAMNAINSINAINRICCWTLMV